MRAMEAGSINSRLALVVAVVAGPSPPLIVDGVAWNELGARIHAVLEGSLSVSVEILGAVTLGAVHVEDLGVVSKLG